MEPNASSTGSDATGRSLAAMTLPIRREEGIESKRLSDGTLLVYDPRAAPAESGRWIYGEPVSVER